jgi:chromosome partitioning protein
MAVIHELSVAIDPILKKCLEPIRARGYYDYILIDSPPTLGGWVMNVMCASDYVIIPVEASPWGLFGLANMFDFLNKVKEISPRLEVMGVMITKADERKNYFKQTLETLHESGAARVFETYVRTDSAVEWSQDNSIPVVAYKKYSRSAIEYLQSDGRPRDMYASRSVV